LLVHGLARVIERLRPTVLIGVSAAAGVFTDEAIRAMARVNERPVIFALSNPTLKAECTPDRAYAASDGRAIFASGSPVPEVVWNDRVFRTGQGNNVYIFPGLGLGVLATKATRVTTGMFLAAARTLAEHVLEAELAEGRLYPELRRIRVVSLAIAAEVARVAHAQGLANAGDPANIEEELLAQMFDPAYQEMA